MESKLEIKEKQTLEERILMVMDRYDEWKATVFPKSRSKYAVQKIAAIWAKEVKNAMREMPETDTFTLYFTHPVEARKQLAANEWCLYPFSYNFKNKGIHRALGTYMWTTYGKHPAYAVGTASEEDWVRLGSALKWELLDMGYDYAINVISDTIHHNGELVTRVGVRITVLRRA